MPQEHKPGAKARAVGKLRSAAGVGELEARVSELEERIREFESAHLRFAELVDVVQELLVPMARQDQGRVREVVERYTNELDQRHQS